MSLDARIRELSTRHDKLDAAISAELRSPGTDDLQLGAMKKEKLRLKDEIAVLSGRAHAEA